MSWWTRKAPDGPQPSRSSDLDLLAASFDGRWERTTEVTNGAESVILRIVTGAGDSFAASGPTTALALTALVAKAAKLEAAL